MRIRLLIAGIGLLSLALVVAWKSGGFGSDASKPARHTEGESRHETPVRHVVARASAPLEVFARPGAEVPSVTLPATTSHGSPRALLVLDDGHGWLEVAVPMRPTQASGWVRSEDVELRTITTSVVVDVRRRVLTAYDSGKVVLESPVAVGTAANPTPMGEFFVTDLLAVPDADGPYGPFAIGLSAYSQTLTEFAGGDGQVGIHGTNDPDSIGGAISHGCVRLPNDVIEQLFELVSLGTPVALK